MTVSIETNFKRVTGDDVTTEVTVTFKVLSASDLVVYRVPDSTGVKVPVSSGYTTVLDTDEEGATVTFDDPLVSTNDYLFVTEYALTQTADLPLGGPFREAAIEGALDRSRVIDIQQQEEINRSIKLKAEDVLNVTGYSGLEIEVDTTANRMNAALVWNSAGTAITTGPTTTDIAAAQGYAEDAETAKDAAEAAQSAAEDARDEAAASAASIDFDLGQAILQAQTFG